MAQYRSKVAYGLSDALLAQAPIPIQALRAPTTGDIGYLLGTIWINKPSAAIYILASIVANSATWQLLSSSGGTGSFSTLTVTGDSSLGISTAANTITLGGTGANTIGIGAAQAGGSIEIGDNMVAGTINIGGATQTGAIFIGGSTASQTISIGNSGTSAKTILIGSGSAANVVTLGSTTGVAATTIRGGTGGIFLNAPFTELPGPIFLYTGAGAPGNGLALHAGDMYIRTDPAGATSRLYIATGAGAWTNVTCAG